MASSSSLLRRLPCPFRLLPQISTPFRSPAAAAVKVASPFPSSIRRWRWRCPLVSAVKGGADGKDSPPPPPSPPQGNGKEGESLRTDGRPTPLVGFRWRDLLDPDPENLVALGLTGLLAWASVQALFQIFFISLAILLAALKYSFIAALLLFIVITLL